MSTPPMIVTDAPPDAFGAMLLGGLIAFNDSVSSLSDQRTLAVIVQSGGVPVGGALGRTSRGILVLTSLYLPASLRAGGTGRAVLERFEQEGRHRGCRQGVVDTLSFQAPGFYEKCGWVRFGEIPCDPPGATRIWLRKTL